MQQLTLQTTVCVLEHTHYHLLNFWPSDTDPQNTKHHINIFALMQGTFKFQFSAYHYMLCLTVKFISFLVIL
jgi:hypothetical protein